MLERISEYALKVIPMEFGQILLAVGVALWSIIFPAPGVIYQAFIVLIIIDTITGILASLKAKTFNSRTLRLKFFNKVAGYLLIPTALATFATFLTSTPFETMFELATKMTLASIAFVELTSIFENTGAMLGRKITLRVKAQDIKDLMESNHVNDRDSNGRSI